ncbi:TRAP transporter small permease [Herbivorax sp. ANBcel31]|uniref:TRAP transporter small permease n=1 Tax=Herbivorax sp. ANBcel31 TaxID=3069754 RepID=UPI0027B79431|nr:TRAP transporter small permease [Herbivorax sp. ANBcel31]MDQ2086304.1 TRAP transporter small permease [Herbivorax sp. ANBcel31]
MKSIDGDFNMNKKDFSVSKNGKTFNKIETIIVYTSKMFDNVAGGIVFATMLIVVVNVIMRRVFNSPISGAHDVIGLLTSSFIGLSIAYCAVQKAHIAVEFIMEKISSKKRRIIDIIVQCIYISFLSLFSIRLFIYGYNVSLSGEVSPTARIPLFPFIFIVATGFTFLCLVVITQFSKNIQEVIRK